MPANWSADAQRVIVHVDTVFDEGNEADIHQIKILFRLQQLEHLDDVAGAREFSIGDF